MYNFTIKPVLNSFYIVILIKTDKEKWKELPDDLLQFSVYTECNTEGNTKITCRDQDLFRSVNRIVDLP